MHGIADRIRSLIEEIHEIADKCNRDPQTVELMAVTKTRSYEEVQAAIAAGIVLFGENRVQEATSKFEGNRKDYRLHLIGHLQRNKARDASRFFDEIESIDKLSTVDAILKHRTAESEKIDPLSILIEMNTSGEDTKSGVPDRDSLHRLVDGLLLRPGVSIRGMMTIAPFTTDENQVRSSFASLREELEALRRTFDLAKATTLSMGMSSDYPLAIEEGSTRIRIGTSLFGSRDT